jgi:hypothetical protein
LWIKKSGRAEKNEMPPLIEDLDSLPFPDFIDRDNKYLVDRGRIIKDPPIVSAARQYVYPIMATQGCPYECAFCCNGIFRRRYHGKGQYVRRRSVRSIITELEQAVQKRSVHFVMFWDDFFSYDEVWVRDFCFEYTNRIGKPFMCHIHPEHIKKGTLRQLRCAGLICVAIGIQSGSEHSAQSIYKRDQNNQYFIDLSRFIKSLKIRPKYDLISDNPYESEHDQEETVNLLLQLPKPYQFNLYSLCWFPETELTKRALSDGYIQKNNIEQYSAKALNNFFVYIPRSRDTRSLFWNCIKAMAVNPVLPQKVTNFCRHSKFLRKHPYVLYLFCRAYVKRQKRKKRILKNNQNMYVVGKSTWLSAKPDIEISFYLISTVEAVKKAGIVVRSDKIKTEKIDFQLRLLSWCDAEYRVENEAKNEDIVWMFSVCVESNNEYEYVINLEYPRLFYMVGDESLQATSLMPDSVNSLKSGRYYLQLSSIESGSSARHHGDVLLEF